MKKNKKGIIHGNLSTFNFSSLRIERNLKKRQIASIEKIITPV
jgi:hypothetical protein